MVVGGGAAEAPAPSAPATDGGATAGSEASSRSPTSPVAASTLPSGIGVAAAMAAGGLLGLDSGVERQAVWFAYNALVIETCVLHATAQMGWGRAI